MCIWSHGCCMGFWKNTQSRRETPVTVIRTMMSELVSFSCICPSFSSIDDPSLCEQYTQHPPRPLVPFEQDSDSCATHTPLSTKFRWFGENPLGESTALSWTRQCQRQTFAPTLPPSFPYGSANSRGQHNKPTRFRRAFLNSQSKESMISIV